MGLASAALGITRKQMAFVSDKEALQLQLISEQETRMKEQQRNLGELIADIKLRKYNARIKVDSNANKPLHCF